MTQKQQIESLTIHLADNKKSTYHMFSTSYKSSVAYSGGVEGHVLRVPHLGKQNESIRTSAAIKKQLFQEIGHHFYFLALLSPRVRDTICISYPSPSRYHYSGHATAVASCFYPDFGYSILDKLCLFL